MVSVSQHNARARANGGIGNLTDNDWDFLLYLSQGYCSYCNKYVGTDKLVLDHVIPVNKGGHSTLANTMAICQQCNASKHDYKLNFWSPTNIMSRSDNPQEPLLEGQVVGSHMRTISLSAESERGMLVIFEYLKQQGEIARNMTDMNKFRSQIITFAINVTLGSLAEENAELARQSADAPRGRKE